MRGDWDARARENATHYIACGHAQADDAFWASGAADLENLILQDVTLDPAARALEIGCGIGRLLRPLSERVERAIGVDISPEMIARAREALGGRRNVDLMVTRGTLDGISDAMLDFVASFIVFQHVPSREAVYRYIGEAARVLKSGGVFRFQVDGRRRFRVLGTDTWSGVSFDAEALCRRLGPMGFDVLDRWGEGTHYLWITAERRNEPGRPESRAIAVRRRSWDEAALRSLLGDLGLDPAEGTAAVVAGSRSLRSLARPFLRANRRADAETFLRRAYRVFLGRAADASGLSFYAGQLADGKRRGYVVDCLLASAEARARFRT